MGLVVIRQEFKGEVPDGDSICKQLGEKLNRDFYFKPDEEELPEDAEETYGGINEVENDRNLALMITSKNKLEFYGSPDFTREGRDFYTALKQVLVEFEE